MFVSVFSSWPAQPTSSGRPCASSSALESAVTFLPSKMDFPFEPLAWMKALEQLRGQRLEGDRQKTRSTHAGPWQTPETNAPSFQNCKDRTINRQYSRNDRDVQGQRRYPHR